jgi:hypothetical protein
LALLELGAQPIQTAKAASAPSRRALLRTLPFSVKGRPGAAVATAGGARAYIYPNGKAQFRPRLRQEGDTLLDVDCGEGLIAPSARLSTNRHLSTCGLGEQGLGD